MTEAAPSEAAPALRPWGYWATFGWTLLALIASTAASVEIVVWWRSVYPPAVDIGRLGKLPHEDGTAFSLLAILAASIQIAMLVLAARLARWPAGKYLGLIRPRGRDLAVGIAGLVLLLLASGGLAYLLGKDSGAAFLIDFYKSARAAGALAPLWMAVVVVGRSARRSCFAGSFIAVGSARDMAALSRSLSYRCCGRPCTFNTTGLAFRMFLPLGSC